MTGIETERALKIIANYKRRWWEVGSWAFADGLIEELAKRGFLIYKIKRPTKSKPAKPDVS